MKRGIRTASLTGAVMVIIAQSPAQSPPQDLDNEIIRLRKELAQVQLEAQRTRSDIEKERKEFDAYRTRAAARQRSLSAGIDSLEKDIARVSRRNDSLSAELNAVSVRTRQTELSQESMRAVLIALCDKVERAAANLPPLTSQAMIGATALLKSDLSSKSVDNAEACTRLIQILNQMEEGTGSIQTAQVASPLPEIPGIAYRIRIGALFEAITNEKATRAALYRGKGSDGKPHWETIDDPALARTIMNAINVREGKSLPAFVQLPLAGSDTKGGNQ